MALIQLPPTILGLAFVLALSSSGCAHRALTPEGLQQVQRPAFVSRVVKEPDVRVSGLDRAEQERTQAALRARVGRFEVAERLRAFTTARLPQRRPWTAAVPPAQVAGLLQSFLVEESGRRRSPDFGPLAEAGADGVVELVIESYGLHGPSAESGVFLEGYGRLQTLDGKQLYRRNFRADGLLSKLPPLDARALAQNPDLFRTSLNRLLEGVAAQLAEDLDPGAPPLK